MSRKNISDFTGNKDRALVRELRNQGSSYSRSWDDFDGFSASTNSTGPRSYSTVSGYKGGGSLSPTYVRCYTTHKPMKLPKSNVEIYGGSCSSPMVNDADIYIGFERGMSLTKRSYPWNKGHEIQFYVPDMGIPADAVEYKKLVQWTKRRLDAGDKVHAGCIGGHGRTGMFLAALVSLYGEADAIKYVRKHYCKKAVESQAQVDFLGTVFGVKPAEPTKGNLGYASKKNYAVYDNEDEGARGSSSAREATRAFFPLTGAKGIWG